MLNERDVTFEKMFKQFQNDILEQRIENEALQKKLNSEATIKCQNCAKIESQWQELNTQSMNFQQETDTLRSQNSELVQMNESLLEKIATLEKQIVGLKQDLKEQEQSQQAYNQLLKGKDLEIRQLKGGDVEIVTPEQ